MALSIALLHPTLQLRLLRKQRPASGRVLAVSWNSTVDRSFQRREIHLMRPGFVEPPIAVFAAAAVPAIWIVCAEDGIRAGAIDRGRLQRHKSSKFRLQVVDFQVLIISSSLYQQPLPLRGRRILA